MFTQHGNIENYETYITNENDRRAEQPSKILLTLKPHQQTSLAKMVAMETKNSLLYTKHDLYVNTNIGILADEVGKGKTLTALSLIATANNTNNEKIGDIKANYTSGYWFMSYRKFEKPANNLINATLIVVPHGVIFRQWKDTIKEQTKLTVLSISCSKEVPKNKENLQNVDIILVSDTFYNTFLYIIQVRFKRLIIDEADSICIPNMKDCDADFVWLITATPGSMQNSRNKGLLTRLKTFWHYYASATSPDYLTIMVKNSTSYLAESMKLPNMHVITHLTRSKGEINLQLLKEHLPQELMNAINADNLPAVIESLGGNVTTSENVIELITQDYNKTLRNLELKKDYVEKMLISDTVKRAKMQQIEEQIQKMQNKIRNIEERMAGISEQDCTICSDKIQEPLTLTCLHFFCAKCIVTWMQTTRQNTTCPTCRELINGDKLLLIKSASIDQESTLLTKIDMIVKLVLQSTNGKFLIFSDYNYSFKNITEKLSKENIETRVVCGNEATAMSIINKYKNGNLKVLMLNSQYDGAGINLENTTDIILYHRLDANKEKQVIGRAQRFGRNGELKVHKLCYANEVL